MPRDHMMGWPQAVDYIVEPADWKPKGRTPSRPPPMHEKTQAIRRGFDAHETAALDATLALKPKQPVEQNLRGLVTHNCIKLMEEHGKLHFRLLLSSFGLDALSQLADEELQNFHDALLEVIEMLKSPAVAPVQARPAWPDMPVFAQRYEWKRGTPSYGIGWYIANSSTDASATEPSPHRAGAFLRYFGGNGWSRSLPIRSEGRGDVTPVKILGGNLRALGPNEVLWLRPATQEEVAGL